jgi:hypothetical protein
VSGLERLIVDLVQIAEAPLYSTYRWLGRQLGRDLPLSEFLRVVAAAIERDVLRLWSVDAKTGDRTELYEVPGDLEHRYMAEPALDSRYDPFGMSLTLGAAADVDAEPEWEFTVNFDDQVFEITAMAGREEEALDELSRCYPDLHPTVTARGERGERRHLAGSLRHVSGT